MKKLSILNLISVCLVLILNSSCSKQRMLASAPLDDLVIKIDDDLREKWFKKHRLIVLIPYRSPDDTDRIVIGKRTMDTIESKRYSQSPLLLMNFYLRYLKKLGYLKKDNPIRERWFQDLKEILGEIKFHYSDKTSKQRFIFTNSKLFRKEISLSELNSVISIDSLFDYEFGYSQKIHQLFLDEKKQYERDKIDRRTIFNFLKPNKNDPSILTLLKAIKSKKNLQEKENMQDFAIEANSISLINISQKKLIFNKLFMIIRLSILKKNSIWFSGLYEIFSNLMKIKYGNKKEDLKNIDFEKEIINSYILLKQHPIRRLYGLISLKNKEEDLE